MFDRELCCRQLRYSGMMETIRIRRAGYPIRHTFIEFVDRYRFLISGCPPAHKLKVSYKVTECQKLYILIIAIFMLQYVFNSHNLLFNFQDNCRAATAKICQSALGKADYQLGKTKVFLKDAQDLFLELERDRVLTRKILILQRCIRGW